MFKFNYFIDYCKALVDYRKCTISNNFWYRRGIYKMPSIKYSKRMLNSASAVDMYILIRAALHCKVPETVNKNRLPAFNYAVPAPDN